MMNLLNPEDIYKLTGFSQVAKQAEELNRLGITHKVNKNNQIIVHMDTVRIALDAIPMNHINRGAQPDFDALDG